MTSEVGWRWRYRGSIPPYEIFVQQLHSDVLAHFVICTSEPFERIGYVCAYNADFRNQIVHYAAVFSSGNQGKGYGAEATLAFIDHIFRSWPFRKIYTEMAAFNYVEHARTSDFLTKEATLTDYYYYDGSYWDQYVFSFTGDQWRKRSEAERAERFPDH